ncbi:MAG: bacillithiol biosynthesis cysteine-adding enzyme BshC [Acidobacteria bacterium]|nr:bacillithiol biosynthesis cysteine-adding enzyme BshC [Acidobacteriota bacterium]
MPPDPIQTVTPLRRPIDLRRFPWVRRLAADYAYAYGGLAPFFAGDPSEESTWRDAVARAHRYPRNREAIARVVADQQRQRNAPAYAKAAAERLKDTRSVAIVTGQQAGLFGGPDFTLLKALTALKLAAHIEQQYHIPTVPVFWIDSEDHDWDEVRTCGVLDAEFAYRAISLPSPQGAGESPVASVRLDDSILTALAELQESLQKTEFTPDVMARVRSAYEPGRGMADAFGRWLEAVLGEQGLVVFDAADPAAKPLAAQVFSGELRSAGTTSALAAAAGAALATRGYHAQVSPQDDSVALFRLDGMRKAIKRRDGALMVGDFIDSAEALLNEASTHPESFSPNVLLRPIVQDTLFPTVGYVAGPNELGYLAQLRGVYDHFRVPMPVMYPRISATLIDAAAARFLGRYDLPIEALQAQDESALNRLLAAHLPASVEASLETAARAIEDGMQSVIGAVPTIDPTLEGAARSTLGRMEHDLQSLRAKIIHAIKRRDETLRRQFARARAQVFPDGHPQERAVGFVYFLNRHGPGLIERLTAELPLDMGIHWIISL